MHNDELMKVGCHCQISFQQRVALGIFHYNDVIMSTMASQITSPTTVYSAVYSGADQGKYQSSVSLAFVWGIHRGPVNSPHKWPVTRKMFPFDDVIMLTSRWRAWKCDTFLSIVVGSDNRTSILPIRMHGEFKQYPQSHQRLSIKSLRRITVIASNGSSHMEICLYWNGICYIQLPPVVHNSGVKHITIYDKHTIWLTIRQIWWYHLTAWNVSEALSHNIPQEIYISEPVFWFLFFE